MESLFEKDIDLLEGVQRRATNMILGYKHYCYKDRLALCQLLTFEGRRLRGDLIQAFKLLKGLDLINYNNFFVIRCGYPISRINQNYVGGAHSALQEQPCEAAAGSVMTF